MPVGKRRPAAAQRILAERKPGVSNSKPQAVAVLYKLFANILAEHTQGCILGRYILAVRKQVHNEAVHV